MSCSRFLFLRTVGHDLIQDDVAKMCRYTGKHISWDSKKAKSRSVGYSPHHIPDLTLLHGAPDKSHILIDVVGPSVVTDNIIDASSAMPRVAAAAAESAKFDMFGDVRPHTVLPFAVEDGGALGIEALKFFHQCKDACGNGLNTQDSDVQTWSARGFSNFFFQSLSVSNYRGISHLLSIVGDTIRCSHL